MEESEADAERRAVAFDRSPERFVDGVVIDDEHFVVLIIQPGECVEGLDDQFRRLVVRGNVDRHFGCIARDVLRTENCASNRVRQTTSRISNVCATRSTSTAACRRKINQPNTRLAGPR
jgi:hypothetical protein